MVKLTRPGLAQGASGTLADQLTFSNWKGKPTLKLKQDPRQPKAPGQKAMRAIMAFLSSGWSKLAPQFKDSWNALAAASNVSPFNAYQRENLRRWRSFLRPSASYPPAEIGNLGSGDQHAATGHVRYIEFKWRVVDAGEIWGQQVHLVTGNEVLPKWNDLIHIEPVIGTGWHTYQLRPFQPGLHWLCITRFTGDGRAATFNKWFSATVLP